VRDETAQEQRHLRALGCDPGAVDGIPGARTLEAQRCAAGLAAGL
jgi:peptidoglycan hydrolase-like protein with peptidoglycan-binding domain